ncbi:hypothetical protein DFJ63DRAFT_336549 [Scheffersomyces coipomensis]|uniref:uncharacterized protein n=1 Tax=Scheffersomyces coipomensis TaxID=1788519 RepID=UPI00315D9C49
MLQALVNLDYLHEVYGKLKEGHIISLSNQTKAIRDYEASKETLIEYLNKKQRYKHAKNDIELIKETYDYRNVIQDSTRLILLVHRFTRVDLFQDLEYTGEELNEIAFNFMHHITKTYIEKDKDELKVMYSAFATAFHLSITYENLIKPGIKQKLYERKETSFFGSDNYQFDGDYKQEITSHKLWETIGHFQPKFHGQSIPSAEINFNKETYSSMFIWEFRYLVLKAEAICSTSRNYPFYNNIFMPMKRIVEPCYGYKIETSKIVELEVGSEKFSITIEKSFNINEEYLIPLKVYDDLTKSFESYNPSSIGADNDNLPFIKIFFELFIECVVCKSSVGFVSDASTTLYIKFPRHKSINNAGKGSIFKSFPCEVTRLYSNKDFLQCMVDATTTITAKDHSYQIEKIFSMCCLASSDIQNTTNGYFKQFHKSMKDYSKPKPGLQSLITLSSNRIHSMNPGIISFPLLDKFEIPEIYKQFYQPNFNQQMVYQLKKLYGSDFVFGKKDTGFDVHEVTSWLGSEGIYTHYGVVLKFLCEQWKYILKVYYPLDCQSSTGSKYNLEDSINACFISFMKECYSYHVLSNESFVPKVHKVGIFNKELLRSHKYDSLRGFFLVIDNVNGKTLSFPHESSNQYKDKIIDTTHKMHSLGISRSTVPEGSIQVKNDQVFFTDFGSSVINIKNCLNGFENLTFDKSEFDATKVKELEMIESLFPSSLEHIEKHDIEDDLPDPKRIKLN